MDKVINFLTENHTFFLATEDGDKPRVRPLGFFMVEDGKLYLGIGKQKESYKQLQANPNLELCGCSPKGQWLRVKGKAVMDDREGMFEKAAAVMPALKDMYNEKTGNVLGLFYIGEAVAEIADMQGGFEKIEF